MGAVDAGRPQNIHAVCENETRRMLGERAQYFMTFQHA